MQIVSYMSLKWTLPEVCTVLNNGAGLQKAKVSIRKIFSYLNIVRVICVDDQYDNTPTIERFKSLYYSLLSENILIPSLQNITSGDQDFEDMELEKHWTGLSLPAQKSLLQEMRKGLNSENDDEYANILKSLLQPYGLQELSLSQWRALKPKYIQEAKNARTLFLFDQDFRGEGGSNEEGFNLVADLLESKGD